MFIMFCAPCFVALSLQRNTSSLSFAEQLFVGLSWPRANTRRPHIGAYLGNFCLQHAYSVHIGSLYCCPVPEPQWHAWESEIWSGLLFDAAYIHFCPFYYLVILGDVLWSQPCEHLFIPIFLSCIRVEVNHQLFSSSATHVGQRGLDGFTNLLSSICCMSS